MFNDVTVAMTNVDLADCRRHDLIPYSVYFAPVGQMPIVPKFKGVGKSTPWPP